ncbi:MAG: putative metal-binding motif-containing protein [Deltaproteobacteria bacterium]|nr:putative metal-binding motif-containing protein [Deltaproteobacteria bacterium]
MHVTRLRSVVCVVIAALGAVTIGCGGTTCPEGTVDMEGRCVSPDDASTHDAGPAEDVGALDAFGGMGADAPLPDAFMPMGTDAGALPDVFVEPLDAYAPPDACTPSTFYVDGDGDGHGDPATTVLGCVMPAGAVTLADDCDDDAMAVYPGATETCDGIDQDCDTRLDEGAGTIASFYPDADGDGHGALGGSAVMACAAPPGRAALADDCDDAANTVYPGATELCNGGDEDCDAASDEGIQRLLRAPHEIVAPGGVTFDVTYAVPVMDGYAIVYQSSGGVFVRRVRRDGTSVGPISMIAGASALGPTLTATSPTRVVVLYSRNVSGITYSALGVTVDFATTPPTVGSEVTIAAATNTIGPQGSVIEGRLIVTWITSSTALGRSYALDLTDAGTATTLFPFSARHIGFVAGEGASWIAYDGRRPATTQADCYAQRVTVSPLAVDTEVTTLGDGSGECSMYLASTGLGRAQAMLVYGGGARFESAALAFTTTARVTRRATVTLPMPLGFALPGVSGSSAGFDFAFSTAPGTPAALGQWIATSASGTTAPPMSYGGSAAIASFGLARTSSQHGAIAYEATPTGGSTHALYLQEIGCE